MSPEPFDLNLRHLRALPAIMRHGSINAAAEEVSLSQPALTQGLAKLERQLGTTLFVRRFDGMAATDAGPWSCRFGAALMCALIAQQGGQRRLQSGFNARIDLRIFGVYAAVTA